MRTILKQSAIAALALGAAGVSGQAPVWSLPTAMMAKAQRIVGKLRTADQRRFALAKIVPIFAGVEAAQAAMKRLEGSTP